jgi:hypothetical protein
MVVSYGARVSTRISEDQNDFPVTEKDGVGKGGRAAMLSGQFLTQSVSIPLDGWMNGC